MYSYVIGKTYSFSVYASNILGNDFKNVKVTGTIDGANAALLGLDIQAKHAQIYPQVPSSVGMPNDPTQYNYLLVLTQSGTRTILGMPWIDESSISVVNAQTATAVIDGVTAQDLPLIRQALAANGYNNVALTISN